MTYMYLSAALLTWGTEIPCSFLQNAFPILSPVEAIAQTVGEMAGVNPPS